MSIIYISSQIKLLMIITVLAFFIQLPVAAIEEIHFYASNEEEKTNWSNGVVISNAQNTAR